METGTALLMDIGVTIVAATFFGFIARALRQPLILAYVLAGVVVGPSFFRIITERETIDILAQFGIALLLFMVGLELDIKRLRDVGRVSAGCGIGQIVTTFIFGYMLASYMGFSGYAPFYLAFALTISSTMVVVKLLTDKNEMDTLHGKIVLGTLLVQDVVTIMVLAALPTLGSFSQSVITSSIFTGIGLISFAIVSSKFILPFFMRMAAKSVELLFLFSLSWCFIFASFTYLIFLNLLVHDSPQFALNSVSIGAFLAGLSLASFPYNLEIVGRIRPLKDFFLTLFFASLGMQVTLGVPAADFSSGGALVSSVLIGLYSALSSKVTIQVIIFSLYVLVGSVVIMMSITSMFGYGKRTSFMTAISLAQISEFSLILAVQGQALGHIDGTIFSIITGVVLITITISSYYIMYSKQLYALLLPALMLFDYVPSGKEFEDMPAKVRQHVILCGCHRMGSRIIDTLKLMNEDFIVVDYNPTTIRRLLQQKTKCIYGDIGDFEILDRVSLKDARIVISTIPEQESNLLLIYETKRRNPKTLVFIVADDMDQALELYDAGADYVIIPKMVSGDRASDLIRTFIRDPPRLKKMKEDHIFKLEDDKKDELLWKYEPSVLRSLEKKLVRRRGF
jgi:Kef-type K+ transport system membrane component KefB/voltage-gated potassium channel Kch